MNVFSVKLSCHLSWCDVVWDADEYWNPLQHNDDVVGIVEIPLQFSPYPTDYELQLRNEDGHPHG